jgi:uracil-DNA glycosylase
VKLIDILPKAWMEVLDLPADFFQKIEDVISGKEINPVEEKIFAAFSLNPSEVKIVIVGQDPYPNPKDATGLAFSIPKEELKIPASLRNIKKEIESDIGVKCSDGGNLQNWQEQGVLLLNRILTTNCGESLSHQNIGWEEFTNKVIEYLSQRDVVFILWGTKAQALAKDIDPKKIILGVHPSPLSAHRGFFGSKPFSAANKKLIELGIKPVDWEI